MPPVNPVVVSAGFIAISVAVVAAIAVYESPEIRRMADDLRRRIAIAIQSVGDGNAGREQRREHEDEPVFNRPEDAEGFMLSRGRRSDNDPGVVADEASRRRQREELLYWNRVRMEQEEIRKQEEAVAAAAAAAARSQSPDARSGQSHQTTTASSSRAWPPREALETLQRATRDAAAAAGIHLASLGGAQAQPRTRTSFDQFLRPDHGADRGTFVFNTGADLGRPAAAGEDPLNGGLLRRRKPEGVRGLNAAAIYANPFGDEYGIELDDHDHDRGNSSTTAAEAFSGTAYLIAPDRDETLSDIYSATEPDTNGRNNRPSAMDAVFDPLPAVPATRSVHSASQAPASEVFFDVNDYVAGGAQDSPATLAAAEAGSQPSLRLVRRPEDNHAEEDKRGILPDDSPSGSAFGSAFEHFAPREDISAEAYSSIQAWAQSSTGPGLHNTGFYSPLPVTPSVGMSEPSVISGGELTPTGSLSVWGDDDHSVVGHADAHASAAGSAVVIQRAPPAPPVPVSAAASDYGVLSVDDNDDDASDSVMTPTSWSEVGSVVSESDAGLARA